MTEPIPCPRCSSNLPNASVILLRSQRRRYSWEFWRPKIVSEVTGERVSCQACAHVYSVGPTGTFQHDPKALPPTPQPQAVGSISVRSETNVEKVGSNPPAPPPKPLERPSV